MYNIILGYISALGYIITLLITVLILQKWLFKQKEISRKLVHFFLAFVWIILYNFFTDTIHFILIPFIFVIVNYISYILSRKDNTYSWKCVQIFEQLERKGEQQTPGTVYYALSITIMACFALWKKSYIIPYGMGVFCMAFGDCMAGVVGSNARGFFAAKLYGNKTIGGFFACIIFATLGELFVITVTNYSVDIIKLLIIGIIAGILELPEKGLDNLTVPIGTMMVAHWII